MLRIATNALCLNVKNSELSLASLLTQGKILIILNNRQNGHSDQEVRV